mgnify:CR=1 FL=1
MVLVVVDTTKPLVKITGVQVKPGVGEVYAQHPSPNMIGPDGKVWFTEDKATIQKLRETVFPGGHLNKDVVGKSPTQVGALASTQIQGLTATQLNTLSDDAVAANRDRLRKRGADRAAEHFAEHRETIEKTIG